MNGMDLIVDEVWPTVEMLGRQLGVASLVGGAALGLAWIASRLFTRLSSGVRCWFWRLAFLKLVLAFVVVGGLQLPLLPAEAPMVLQPRWVDTPSGYQLNPKLPLSEPYVPKPVWPVALVLLWFAGALRGSVQVLRGWAHSRRVRNDAVAVPEGELPQLVGEVSRAMGLTDPPWVSTMQDASGPMLVGLLSPTVVLPSKAAKGSADDLRLIVAHELAHFVRNDLLWNLVPTVAQVVFWFHPLVWLGAREMTVDQEIAADELALQACNASLKTYGELLLGFVQVAPLPTPLVALHASGSGQLLKRRLTVLARGAGRAMRTSRAGSASVAVVAILAMAPLTLVKPLVDPVCGQASMAIKDCRFSVVAETLAVNAGFTVVWPPEIEKLTCSVNFQNVQPVTALRQICESLHLVLYRAEYATSKPLYIIQTEGGPPPHQQIKHRMNVPCSMAIKDANALVVLETLGINSGYNFITNRNTARTVSVNFTDVEATDGLNAVADVTGIELFEAVGPDGKVTLTVRQP